MLITKDTLIEELIDILPDSIEYLRKHGIRCIRCGEPIWGSLEKAAKEKNFNDSEIERFVNDLNQMNKKRTR
jgi:methionine synthase II (cobalamin-independent)